MLCTGVHHAYMSVDLSFITSPAVTLQTIEWQSVPSNSQFEAAELTFRIQASSLLHNA